MATAAAARLRDIAHYFEYSASGVEVVQDGLQPYPFGEFLVEHGLLDRAQLFRALCAQDQTGLRLGEAVAALGYLAPSEIDRQLDRFLALPAIVVR